MLAPLEVIAFRSQVRGDALAGSDLDLVIVSEAFEGDRKRAQLGVVRLAVAEGRSLLPPRQR